MNDSVSITLLVDNEAPPGLVAEHGFAAWIDAGDESFLFDTGQGSALDANARTLGIDLGRASALVLSHGHYDHTGGIPAFLASNPHAQILHGRGATIGRLSCHPHQPARQIGMPGTVREALAQLPPERCCMLDAPRYLRPGFGITGPVPRQSAFEDTGGPFYLDESKMQPDLLEDDLSLWFETTDGLVIVTGCCHSGLVNTVRQVQRISGIERVHGIVGGLHLLNAGPQRLDATLEYLGDCAPDFLLPSHCTGAHVVERLRAEFGEAVVRTSGAGQTITVGQIARPLGATSTGPKCPAGR